MKNSDNVRKIIISGVVAVSLGACDNAQAPQPYTPEMASFSNEFDFDPLRGPVKDFNQKLMNAKGEVIKQVNATLSQEGCFDSLAFHDLENNAGAALILDANYYLDALSHEKRVKLQGKCQLAELPAAAVTYDTDDNDFVVAARGKDIAVVYRYDRDGYPLGKTSRGKEGELAIQSKTGNDRRQKLDYTSVSTLNGKNIGTVVQRCKYDKFYNPLTCELTVTDQTRHPPVATRYHIKNTIDYY